MVARRPARDVELIQKGLEGLIFDLQMRCVGREGRGHPTASFVPFPLSAGSQLGWQTGRCAGPLRAEPRVLRQSPVPPPTQAVGKSSLAH